MRLGTTTNVQPDLLVVRHEDIDLDGNVAPTPLLVVEVVSPSSRLVDLHLKPALYAEIGVPSYWVVDPAEDWVVAHELRDSTYVEAARADGDELVAVTEPFPVGLRPTDLLARFR